MQSPAQALAAPVGSDRAAAGVSLAMLALAFAWFWPTLHHGLRSDDYLTIYYADRRTGEVAWGRVFEEFVRPWFGSGELYRPLISVTFGIELALFPGPVGRHLFNVAFVAIAAAAVAATASLLAPRRRALAAMLAGAVVLLHPAAVETAAWLAARVTNVQMAAGALACWFYARHCVLGRPLWPSLLLYVLALLAKEGAVTLPLSLLAIDWLHAPRGPWRPRLRRLAPFAVVLVFYFAWRVVVLGRIGPANENGVAASNLLHIAVRTGQLLLPPDGTGAHRLWAIPCLLLAVLPLWRHLGFCTVLLPLWFFLVLSPTQHLPATADVLYGRFVFDAVPGLALVLALAAATATSPRASTLGLAATLLWLVAMALTSWQWLGQYEDEDRRARRVEAALATAAADATPAQPFACTGLPYLPIFHQKLWGVLGLSPFAARDLAVIGLPELLVPDEKAPQFRYDAAPVHAILAAGGSVGRLDHTTMQFAAIPAPTAGVAELRAAAGAPRVFQVAAPWPGSGVAAIEVQLPGPARELALRFLDDLPTAHAFGTLRKAATAPVTWLATSHALAPVLLQGLGLPFRGVQLEVDGGDPPAGTRLTVHATLPVRPLARRASGQARSRDELFALSQAPPAAEPLRLYLLLPTGVRHMDVPVGGAPMDALLRDHLTWALDLFAPLTVHWFWQTPPDATGQPWRSELDWATAR